MLRKNFPTYKQLDSMDCGPTCLRIVAKHYGRDLAMASLREKTYMTRAGVSMLGISHAGEAIGFRTLGVRLPFDKFRKDALLPCVVHWRQQHFIVVYRITGKHVLVSDPAVGLIEYEFEEFMRGWLATAETGQQIGVALLLEPTTEFYRANMVSGRSSKGSLSYLLNYLIRYRGLLIYLGIGLFTGSLIQLVLPFLTQSIVDVGINTQNIQFIYLVLGGQFLLFIGRISVDFFRRWILLHLSTRINISIVSDFLSKLFRLPVSFFEGKMIGDILRRIEDHNRVERFLSTSSLNILFSFFNLIIFGVVLAIYHLPIFIVFFGASGLYIFYILLFRKRRAELDYKRFQEVSQNQSNLVQTIQGMNDIKMNNCETQKRWEWERIQARLFWVNVQATKIQQLQDAGSMFINESKNMIITVMAALAVVNGEMTLGMMVAVQYIIGQLNAPVNDFIGFTRDLQDTKLSLERIGEIHETDDENVHSDNDDVIIPDTKTLLIRNLSFKYDGASSQKVLDGVDLIIPEGKVTAIVGASGSGKTTLMKLLLKFYVTYEGQISLGGTSLKDVKASDWRKQCGTVMQDGFIFADTIARNIALSDEYVNRQRLLKAVRVANCQEFIEALPLGYKTIVGQNGIGLSQGQRQRLLIARAVYKNPDFIFFDEATSALDANNEKVIMENLQEFFQGKTAIVIAHRLSTVKNADQVVVLEDGKIVEVGSHAELTRSKGKYFNLVKNQLELGS